MTVGPQFEELLEDGVTIVNGLKIFESFFVHDEWGIENSPENSFKPNENS
jgi:hypothetical protein